MRETLERALLALLQEDEDPKETMAEILSYLDRQEALRTDVPTRDPKKFATDLFQAAPELVTHAEKVDYDPGSAESPMDLIESITP